MKKTINPVTGNQEIQFEGKLLSISDQPLALNNEKKTLYRPATIEFVNMQGVVTTVGALCYEKNFSHGMKVGTTYQCRAIFTPEQENPLVTISHLISSQRASAADFGFDEVQSVVSVDADHAYAEA